MSLTEDQITAQNFKDFFNIIKPYLNNTTNMGFTPVGTIISVMGKTAPNNYLSCEGQIVNISDYPELANYFTRQFEQVNYFGGDGVSTFGIPDLRGEFLRGTGTNSHVGHGMTQGSGENVGIHQDATLHFHSANDGSWAGTVRATAESSYQDTWDSDKAPQGGGFCQLGLNYNNGEKARDWIYTSRPTNTSVLYCIATKNIYVDAKYDYSFDEKVVGTWIDGKPLYQKTYELTNLNYSDDNDIGLMSLNIDTIVSYSGTCIANNGTVYDINVPSNDSNYATGTFITLNKLLGMRFGSGVRNNYFNKTLFTIQYTKTTD